MKTTVPSAFTPVSPDDFIGPARKVATLLHRKIQRIKEGDGGCFAGIFYGPPGTGKSALVQCVARWATGSPFGVTDTIGQSVSVDQVREWRKSTYVGNMFSAYSAIIVDEVDTVPKAAMVEMLKLLDQKPKNYVFLMTTNKELEELPERFQTRAIPYKIGSPDVSEIMVRLRDWVPDDKARDRIVKASNGNVRAAMLDAEAWMDREEMK